MGSDDAILALARCSCGHEIGRHDEDGCPGAEATFCICTLTPAAALNAAIERIRRLSLGRSRNADETALSCTVFDAEKMLAQLHPDDHEIVGPVRALEPATMIAMLMPRLIRPQ